MPRTRPFRPLRTGRVASLPGEQRPILCVWGYAGVLRGADNRGNLAVTYPGPVSSFRLDYWSSAGNGQQAVFLSDFTFDALGC